MQSLAVVMRGLIMREISTKEIKRPVLRETKIRVLNGFVTGTVTALISWLWKGNAILGLVIGLAMVVNLAVAGLAGASIPVSMKAIWLDPAQSPSKRNRCYWFLCLPWACCYVLGVIDIDQPL